MGCEASGDVVGGLMVALIFFFVLIAIASAAARRRNLPATGTNSRLRIEVERKLIDLQRRYGGELERGKLTFEHEGFRVRVQVDATLTRPEGQTTLDVTGPLAPIVLSPESTISGGDIPTGDPDFDGVVRVKGDGPTAVAVLEPAARNAIKRAILAGFLKHRNVLRMESYSDDVDLIAPHITPALELARLLRNPIDLDTTLVSRLRHEPLDDGRLAIAVQVPATLAENPEHLRALCALPDDEVRLVLASRLNATDLWATLPEATLIALLGSPRVLVQRESISRLGQCGTVEAVAALTTKSHWNSEVRGLAKDAILAIQSRATGSRGELALAHHDGGLSLTETRTEVES